MRNEKLAKLFLLISSIILMIWGVIGIIYQSFIFLRGNIDQINMFGGIFTFVASIVDVMCCSAAILYIKKEDEIIKIFTLVFSILLGIFAFANIAILGILIYGTTKGESLNSLDWFNWINFLITIICSVFYIIGYFSISKIRKDLEDDKKRNLANYR